MPASKGRDSVPWHLDRLFNHLVARKYSSTIYADFERPDGHPQRLRIQTPADDGARVAATPIEADVEV